MLSSSWLKLSRRQNRKLDRSDGTRDSSSSGAFCLLKRSSRHRIEKIYESSLEVISSIYKRHKQVPARMSLLLFGGNIIGVRREYRKNYCIVGDVTSVANAISNVWCVRPRIVISFLSAFKLTCNTSGIHEAMPRVVSLLFEGPVRRRPQFALVFETNFINRYALSEGKIVEDVHGAGKLSPPNLRHQWYHRRKWCRAEKFNSTFGYVSNAVCESPDNQSDKMRRSQWWIGLGRNLHSRLPRNPQP